MRIILLVVVLLSLAPICIAGNFSAKHNKVIKYFQSSEEPTAKDATWTQVDIFKVGVINNGRSRDGYAQYVCSILDDYGFKGKKTWVQIIDVVRLTKGDGKWVKLGEAHCR
jgi:hypothetical protein